MSRFVFHRFALRIGIIEIVFLIILFLEKRNCPNKDNENCDEYADENDGIAQNARSRSGRDAQKD